MCDKKEDMIIKDEYLIRLSSPPETTRPQKLISLKDNQRDGGK